MHPTYSRVLSQENSDDSDVDRARPLRLPHNIDTDTVDIAMDVGSEGELVPMCVPPSRPCSISNLLLRCVPQQSSSPVTSAPAPASLTGLGVRVRRATQIGIC